MFTIIKTVSKQYGWKTALRKHSGAYVLVRIIFLQSLFFFFSQKEVGQHAAALFYEHRRLRRSSVRKSISPSVRPVKVRTAVLFQWRADQIDRHAVQDEVAHASDESRFQRQRPHARRSLFPVDRATAEPQHDAVLQVELIGIAWKRSEPVKSISFRRVRATERDVTMRRVITGFEPRRVTSWASLLVFGRCVNRSGPTFPSPVTGSRTTKKKSDSLDSSSVLVDLRVKSYDTICARYTENNCQLRIRRCRGEL